MTEKKNTREEKTSESGDARKCRCRRTTTPMMDSPMMTGVVAGVLIAGAIIYAGGGLNQGGSTAPSAAPLAVQPVSLPAGVREADVEMKPVDKNDHILGKFNAKVKIVEFSDLDCPFCKKFHPTVKRVAQEFGPRKVAVVYRHFPLDKLHPEARDKAQATECVASIGGNDSFWEFLDKLFDPSKTPEDVKLDKMVDIAEQIGINRGEFEKCLVDERYADEVAADHQDAIKAGGRGTPYTVVVAPNGKKFVVGGAVPYETLKQTVEYALRQTK